MSPAGRFEGVARSIARSSSLLRSQALASRSPTTTPFFFLSQPQATPTAARSPFGIILNPRDHLALRTRLYSTAKDASVPPPVQEHKDKDKDKDKEKEKDGRVKDLEPPSTVSLPGVGSFFPITNSPAIDAALTTLIGLGMVFMGGVAYLAWYKKRVLDKIELAFEPGYDPALELANHAKEGRGMGEDGQPGIETDARLEHMRRSEQELVDSIIHGKEAGHYFLIIGSKGTGKTTMIFDAMRDVQAEGVAVCEAHPDLEVFRLRLGKALNFEYNEDSQTGLFQRRDPREGGPALDIERAMNKLEKVALRWARRKKRPIVLVFNNVHLLNNDDEGRNMLLQLQQRAESWAESGICTTVFTTDDFWPFPVLRKTNNRMQVLSVSDLNMEEAFSTLKRMRRKITNAEDSDDTFREVVSLTGGRLAFLGKVTRKPDMLKYANHLLHNEKGYLLSQIGLIPDCDDDVMDEQKWSSCSWLLLREFVKMRIEQEKARDAERQAAKEAGTETEDGRTWDDLPMPSLPYWRCRQIMTRPDFLEDLDRKNIIAIDIHHDVRPDSALILQAAREVVEEEDFDEILQSVRDRVDEIESLHRTRELTFKDLAEGDRVRMEVDKNGARRIGWW